MKLETTSNIDLLEIAKKLNIKGLKVFGKPELVNKKPSKYTIINEDDQNRGLKHLNITG